MSVWSSKKECRSYFKSLCAQEFAQGLVQNQKQLSSYLREFMSTQSGEWGAYRALTQEANVDEVFQISHISWLFPRVKDQGNDSHLEFCRAIHFSQGSFGILEPDPNSPVVDHHHIQGLLIPGVAFNKDGHRLGKGKGYYDKALQHFSGLKVGVCFEFQISEQVLPVEEHDVRMDFLITDQGLIDCRRK
ncbi:5-formyltetrahydrofolate cyclo-ligase [Bdellovibrio svalbardensis]|uniref:5-formyltetrahydrofolate cyclo-ligase n=1 Tax=Bdellovibrio svalbardensis TaxID=2972972 RepID=A0ABT6DP36_9BACT|nr:5-formyltetrahydrofolate cyclo-ligase [Bdellovibrio svalbardensis]MDG0817850.1 5-formyltetrahydrofolate cyclo-ligase [Bdellovibrio svalbardensis]